MIDKLKPCPFCGSGNVNDTSPPENSEDPDTNKFSGCYWVCPDCVAVGPFAETPEEATHLWNTRNTIPPGSDE